MDKLLIYLLPITVIAVIGLFYFLRKPAPRTSRNVISLEEARKKRQHKAQACSRCKQRSTLIFYANEAGVVRGFCRDCKGKAERYEELYPV
ncbi:hypothetical protein JJQ72_08395 [Paenibacillus sp. F411]|nr:MULTISPECIES: hypothetical protein [Paenibacillus]MBO2943982.1 hypothetical protein [Paenibacillus sp. F411]